MVSQFGHMFAPRPEVAIAEMLRVLKPGGTIAFATWPPELFTGRMFTVTARYVPRHHRASRLRRNGANLASCPSVWVAR